jgi:hypothetical protein
MIASKQLSVYFQVACISMQEVWLRKHVVGHDWWLAWGGFYPKSMIVEP